MNVRERVTHALHPAGTVKTMTRQRWIVLLVRVGRVPCDYEDAGGGLFDSASVVSSMGGMSLVYGIATSCCTDAACWYIDLYVQIASHEHDMLRSGGDTNQSTCDCMRCAAQGMALRCGWATHTLLIGTSLAVA
jgi:hypothetical protein